MKKYLFLLLLTCSSSISFSQIHEIGFFLGGTNYIGDIGRENYLAPNDVGIGLIYKYNLNPRIALRGTISYFSINGDDSKSTNSFRNNRNRSFSNDIFEFAAGIEFNFFEYNNTEKHNTYFTPYILAEIATFNYKSIDNLVEPGSQSFNSGNQPFKNNFSYTLPVGLGIKGKLSYHLAYAVEAGVRFSLVDDLDFTRSDIEELDFEGSGNDHYIFTGVSLVYAFGRPACYAPRE